MNKDTLFKFKTALIEHRDALSEWLNEDSPQKNIHLGGVSPEAVLQHVSELKDTLESIDKGRFGLCCECDGEVETERLELDYSTQVCLSHYTDNQIRDLEKDLELAGKVQKQLLPSYVPSLPNIQIAVHTDSARIVTGDYYDFFVSKSGNQGLVLADVMGKGLPASMLMSNLQASLRILGPEYDELDILTNRLNDLFCNNLTLIKFISIFLAKINMDSSILQYCNAGHNPAIWWNAASKSIHRLNPTGPAIGLTKIANYKMEEVHYGSGDLFIFYTDGLIETRNSKSEEFGDERLENLVLNNKDKTASEIVKSLLDTAKSFVGNFQDDVTILVLKIL